MRGKRERTGRERELGKESEKESERSREHSTLRKSHLEDSRTMVSPSGLWSFVLLITLMFQQKTIKNTAKI